MGWREFLPCYKLICTIILLPLYFACFFSKEWVRTPTKEYGLWTWCWTEGESECHNISPGTSPGYYEAVRAMACLTFVSHLLYVFTCNPNEGLGSGKKPSFIAFLAMTLEAITVLIMGAGYRHDDRWKDDDPSLGWCFWMAVCGIIFNGLMIWLCWMCYKINKKLTSTTAVVPVNVRRDSNASTFTLVGKRRITIFRTSGADSNVGGASRSASGGGRGAGASTSSASDNRSAIASATSPAGADPSGGQFPVLNLPSYYIPPLPTVAPDPPSYDDVIQDGELSPPPLYFPPEKKN